MKNFEDFDLIPGIFTPLEGFLSKQISSETELFEQVVRAEEDLNKLHASIPLGSLGKNLVRAPVSGLAKDMKSSFKILLYLFKNALRAEKILTGKQLLLIQNSEKYHFESMIAPLSGFFESRSDKVLVSKKTINGVPSKMMNGSLSVSSVMKAFSLVRKYENTVSQTLNKNGIKISQAQIVKELLVQVSLYMAVHEWLSRQQYRLILVDTDRGNSFAVAVCLAAKDLGIQTVTLQHGAIDTLFGYYPLLADQFWCWGSFTVDRFKTAEKDTDHLKLVGNPVAKRRQADFSNLRKAIGFSFSGVHIDKEKAILDRLLSYDELREYRIVLKLRPSIAPLDWMLENDRFEIYNTGASLDANNDFFKQVDLLVNTISSFGAEAVAAGIPVWIFRITSSDDILDNLLVKTGYFTDVSRVENMKSESGKLLENPERYLTELHQRQYKYISSEYYYAFGQDSISRIRGKISEQLDAV